ncbi:MAG: hypothetical protein ACRC6T_14755 [Sarcina sp.]
MDNLDVMKLLKIVGAIVVGYFALKLILGVLSITLGLIIQILIVGALTLGILYGIKMLNSK